MWVTPLSRAVGRDEWEGEDGGNKGVICPHDFMRFLYVAQALSTSFCEAPSGLSFIETENLALSEAAVSLACQSSVPRDPPCTSLRHSMG